VNKMTQELTTVVEGWKLLHKQLGLNDEDARFRGEAAELEKRNEVENIEYNLGTRACNVTLSEELPRESVVGLLRSYFGSCQKANFPEDEKYHGEYNHSYYARFHYTRGTADTLREFTVSVRQPGQPTKIIGELD